MAASTVNISFQDDLLGQIDEVAKGESRSRSELIREAARLYIEKKRRWQSIFAYGSRLGSTIKMDEEEILREIKEVRKAQR
jgi:metal-responsive CopG/Arc/MetJ family transcriptional regulator